MPERSCFYHILAREMCAGTGACGGQYRESVKENCLIFVQSAGIYEKSLVTILQDFC